MKQKKPRRPAALRGTNLYLNEYGYYVWRRADPRTGKRQKRSTGHHVLELALRKAREFDDDFERRDAGLAVYDCWRLELRPLVDEWFDSQEGTVLESTRRARKSQVLRALDALQLRTAADLDHVARIADKIRRLEREGMKRVKLRRGYQIPLRLFSAWLAADKRHLDRDPLALWKPIPTGKAKPARRAFLPTEVARAFLALDRLDELNRRCSSQRTPFLLMLITAPRPGALLSRVVSDFQVARRRIDFGADVGKKRKGEGALDAATVEDLKGYLGNRKEGALIHSPAGVAYTKEVFLDVWREAFGLGLVDELWPADEPRGLTIMHLVNRALLTGRVAVSRGGNPKRVTSDTLRAREALASRVSGLVDRLKADWAERMQGVDVTAFRKTHRTWAEAQGVPAVLIDKQLGHCERSDATSADVLRQIAGSATGRRFYLDTRSAELFDASRSAQAVRQLIDQALEAVSADPDRTALLVPVLAPVPRKAEGGSA